MNTAHIPRFVDLDCVEKCPKHPQNIIIYYCDTHGDIGCYECMSTSHSACVTKDIDDIAEGTKGSFEYKTLLEELFEVKRHTDQIELQAQKNKLNSDICLSAVLQDIRTFRKEIDAHLDQMEHAISEEAKQMNLDHRLLMNDIVEESKVIRENVEQLIEEIKEAETKETKLFIKMNQRKADVMKYKHQTERSYFQEKTQVFVFEPNAELVDIFRTSTNFGMLVVQNTSDVEVTSCYSEITKGEEKATESTDNVEALCMRDEPEPAEWRVISDIDAKQETDTKDYTCDPQDEIKEDKGDKEDIDDDLEEIKPYKGSKINAKLLSDKEDCDISGMDMLTENELVLADYNNRSVKVIDLTENKIKDELKLTFHPYDLTVPKENTIAVTLTNTIQMVHRAHLLRVGENIRVDGECYGIASNKNKLFVSFIKPSPKVEILNYQGDVLQKIEIGTGGVGGFKRPRYIAVCPQERHVYVTDFETDSIVQLSFTGEQPKVFCDTAILNGPYGIHVDVNGQVFVCNYGNDNIYEFSADLSKYKVVLAKTEGIESPQSIYRCSKQNRLFIACTDSTDCNEIRIFSHCSETV